MSVIKIVMRPERYRPNHKTFFTLVNSLRTHESILNINSPRWKNIKIKKTKVMEYIRLNPHSLLRHVDKVLEISKNHLYVTFKKFELHTNRANLVWHLRQSDVVRRLTLISWHTYYPNTWRLIIFKLHFIKKWI